MTQPMRRESLRLPQFPDQGAPSAEEPQTEIKLPAASDAKDDVPQLPIDHSLEIHALRLLSTARPSDVSEIDSESLSAQAIRMFSRAMGPLVFSGTLVGIGVLVASALVA